MDTRDQESDAAARIIATSEPLERPERPESSARPASTTKTERSASPWQESMQQLWHDRRAMGSVAVLIFFVLLALLGPPIYTRIGGIYSSDFGSPIGPAIYHSYDHQELSKQDEGPSARYWLGTDHLGRDLLARLVQGVLISLIVALLVEVVNVVLGVLIGALAGYYGGWMDTILARVTDLTFAFPGLLFAILLTGIFGQSTNDYFANLAVVGPFLANGNSSLVFVSLGLALVSWPLMARYVRGLTLQLKTQQFVEAARASGTNDVQIILRHILPNLFNVVCIVSTLSISGTIIGESGLSLLGLGVRSPGSSLGLMIAEGADTLEIHPWNALLPTLVLTIIVLAISFIGDGLRDAFDTRVSRYKGSQKD
ncbi:MAG: ABC transporter permease [Chloroflexi bacterium]|nr:MAG: ABC transporter permease [Chloroflexota bacterium]